MKMFISCPKKVKILTAPYPPTEERTTICEEMTNGALPDNRPYDLNSPEQPQIDLLSVIPDPLMTHTGTQFPVIAPGAKPLQTPLSSSNKSQYVIITGDPN